MVSDGKPPPPLNINRTCRAVVVLFCSFLLSLEHSDGRTSIRKRCEEGGVAAAVGDGVLFEEAVVAEAVWAVEGGEEEGGSPAEECEAEGGGEDEAGGGVETLSSLISRYTYIGTIYLDAGRGLIFKRCVRRRKATSFSVV